MTVRSRNGFTLIELLIALVLLLMVSAAFWSALAGVQRATRTQTEMAAMRGTMRGGLQIVATDLQELYSDGTTSDIELKSATALTYKAMRGSGVACEVAAGQIKILRALWQGLHDPDNPAEAGLFVFKDGDPDVSADDEWFEATITGTATPGTCGAAPAWVLPITWLVGTEAGIGGGAPVRSYERMELGLMTADGRSWLGLRSVSSGIEPALIPLAGPVTADGVTFWGMLSDGYTETSDPTQMKQIHLRLIGETDRMVNTGVSSAVKLASDTLSLRIELRNSR